MEGRVLDPTGCVGHVPPRPGRVTPGAVRTVTPEQAWPSHFQEKNTGGGVMEVKYSTYSTKSVP